MAAFIREWRFAVLWAILVVAVFYYALRDVPHYAIFTPESYGKHWPEKEATFIHAIGASLGIIAGLVQFSAYVRRRFPVIHRWLGRIYVAGCLVGAPAGLILANASSCETCRPALGSLAVYWFATTLLAYQFVRLGRILIHRRFMIRSFVAMNIFVVVRIAYDLAGPAGDIPATRTMIEFVSVFVPLLLVEAWFSWSADIKAAKLTSKSKT